MGHAALVSEAGTLALCAPSSCPPRAALHVRALGQAAHGEDLCPVLEGLLFGVCFRCWRMKGGICQTTGQMLLGGSERSVWGVEERFTQ